MPALTIPQAFALALQHQQAGRLADAEALCRQILAAQPNHAGALHRLGLISYERGRPDLAVAWIRQAIAGQPNEASAHCNLGEVYRTMGRFDEAMASCRRALELNPDLPEAHNNLGNALHSSGRVAEAVAAYRRALALHPDYPAAQNNLGIALAAQGRLEEAMTAYRRALQLEPSYPEAHNNLGNALRDRGQLDEAIAAYQRALALRLGYPEAHNNLGGLLTKQGRFAEAVAACRQALHFKPSYAQAYNNLGTALAGNGQLAEAVSAYHQALQLKPDLAEVHSNLGNTLKERGQLDEAIAAQRRAIELKPTYPAAQNNLGNALLETGQLDEAVAAYRQALRLDPEAVEVHSNLLFALKFQPDQNDGAIAAEHQRWNRQFCEPFRQSLPPHSNTPDPSRRLKIGYVSADFRSHAVSFFLAPLLEAHDHQSFEIYGYASVHRPDAVTARLRHSVDAWREVRAISDAQLAERVRADGIDILVDLGMHTVGNRLLAFARRPAPVQVSWLGYPGSTGLETIGYRLTDSYLDPSGGDSSGLGGEAVRLPDSWCCYAPIAEFPAISPLPALRNGFVTFGSLNQFCKVNDSRLHCWARILAALPKSRLLLICPQGQARERTLTLFASHGVTPDRLELVAPSPWPEYIRCFERIDLALDSFPVNGMTTTCHALWMGVPTVTQAGTAAISRAGHSLLHTVGLPGWVAQNEEDYIRIATERAADLPQLAELRATLRLRTQSSPLMDAPRFAHHIELAYRTMWHAWCAKQTLPVPLKPFT